MKILKNKAFTLAEVLITLGIIGVVAAMTIPALMSKYRKVVYTARLKKMVSIMDTMLFNIYEDTGSVSDAFKECHDLHTPAGTEGYECFENMIIKYAPIKGSVHLSNERLGGGEKASKYGHAFFYHRLYLPDGSVIAIHIINKDYVIYGFDVNGDRGPNKAGVDLFNVHYYPYNLLYDYQKYGSLMYRMGFTNNQRSSIVSSCKSGNPQACFMLIYHDGYKFSNDYPVKI